MTLSIDYPITALQALRLIQEDPALVAVDEGGTRFRFRASEVQYRDREGRWKDAPFWFFHKSFKFERLIEGTG